MIGVALSVTEALAVPACPEPFEVTQADGTKVLLRKCGDEFLKWYEDAEGFTVIKDEKSKDWFYAELSADASKLVPSAMRVGASAKARPSARRILPQRAVESAHTKNLLAMPTQTAATEERALKTTGTVKQLVALVEFSDQTFVHTRSQFDDLFNKTGYSADGNKGSVYDYYKEISYGKLTVQSTVVGPIKLSKTHAYYGDNASRTQRMTEFGKDVLKALDDEGINFKDYDLDGDGWMDELDVIHAGWAEEFGNNSDNWIWSSRWSYSGGGYFAQYDGVKIASYHTEPELRGSDSATAESCKITQVGVICHEFGHSLGLPDLYDTDGSSEGVGNFCLMGGGSWGYISGSGDDQGTCPVPMSAWSKKKLGWLSPTEITSAGQYSLQCAEDHATAYMLKGNLPGKEYFLIENKTATGFGRGLPGTNKGMLIWHVDDAKTDNTDESHYMVDLEEASGTQHLENNSSRGNDSDYFRSSTMSSFTASTSPNNKSYSGTALGMSITSISAPGATMTFAVSGGDTPVTRPQNDNFANATAISGESGSLTASSANATHEEGEPNHGASGASKSVWWKWTATSAGNMTITTAGSDFDTGLAVYTGSSVANLEKIKEDDDGAGNRCSSVTFSAVAGKTYYIAVAGYQGATGTVKLNWQFQATYSVVYDKGTYGTGSQQTATKTKGVALTLKDAIFTRTGYTQTGWSKNTSGSTKDYGLGASYTTDAAVTLYPYWTKNTYSITYALNSGTHGTTHPTSATYDTAFYVSAPTRSGYTFSGWTVTSGLNTSTAKWGTGSSPSTSISSTSTKCVNGATGNVYFKNLTPTSSGSVTLTANWTANTTISLSTALDNTSLIFTTGGGVNWFGQKTVTHDGADAARSGTISHNGSSYMQTTVTGPGIISFWWYASSEGGSRDYLEFLDGTSQLGTIGGTSAAWTKCSYPIGAGSHTLKWNYRKNGSVSSGLDAGFVDQVVWTDNIVTGVEDLHIPFVSGGGIYKLILKNGDEVAFYDSWLTDAGISVSGGITASLLNAMGRNGLPRYQSYLFGLEPESSVPAEEQLQPTITFDANGMPRISCTPRNDNDLITYKTLGKTSLNDAEWFEVPPGSESAYKFFKVRVELAK